MSNSFQCSYCFQKWHKKNTMEKHSIMCGFWHKSSKINEDDYDITPSVTELFKLVKEFAFKCDKLQKRIEQLEKKQSNQQKKQILNYLQDQHVRSSAIELFRTFTISREHLEIVFEDDLTAGIKACIKTHLCGEYLPIIAFSQKPNILYIYDVATHENKNNQTNTWHIMTNGELDKLISILSFKFLQAFVAWKKENFPQLEINNTYDLQEEDPHSQTSTIHEQIKQQQQTYMIKINGLRVNEDKRRNDVKQMLYTYLQKPLPTIVEIV